MTAIAVAAPPELDPRVPHAAWELVHDAPYSILDVHDDEGRPLGERTASAAAQAGVEMELRRCPYPGGRHHHAMPMNASGLRQARHCWDDVLDGIARVRWQLIGAPAATLFEVWAAARALAAVPAYLIRQGRAIPGPVAATYKVSLGINQSCGLMLFESLATGLDLTAPADGAAIHRFTEERGLFFSTHGVCAGSDVMVAQILATYCDAAEAPTGAPGAVAAELGDLARLAAWSRAEAAGYLLKVAQVATHLDARLAGGAAPVRPAQLRLAQLADLLVGAPSSMRRAVAAATAGLATLLLPGVDPIIAHAGALARRAAAANDADLIDAAETAAATAALAAAQGAALAVLPAPWSTLAPPAVTTAVLERIAGAPAPAAPPHPAAEASLP